MIKFFTKPKMYTSELMEHIGDYLSNIIHLQVMDMAKGQNQESVKSILGRHTKILVKYMVKLETKGDKTENRVLVFTPVRIYLLIAKVPTKIECHFHYLDIQAVESKKSTHFSIITNDRPYSFATSFDAGSFSANADVILTDLASAIKHIFPTVPLKYIIRKIDIQPPEREVVFSEEFRPTDPRSVGPCGGFSTQYACMCDFHGVPYREEVAWDIDTIYLSHDTRVLNLRDFDHLEPKDLMAIVSALEYNTFFRGLKASHMRLSNETLERILHVLKRSMWLEELHLEALGLRSDFLHKLAVSVITNNNPAIRTIDLSHNLIEDKGAIHLAGPIAKVSKGLCKLALAHCGLTSKGVNQMSHSLSLNQSISNSLTHLDLSGNSLKDDITNLHNFLAQPNVLEHLDLSSTDITLENLFGALLRGCATHLAHLNVSHNSFSTKKGKEIPPSFKQFFTSTLSLKHLNIAGCKLPMEALKNLLLGLACNESTAGLYLDLSSNTLGAQGAHVLESCIHGVRVLQSLDISDNNLDAELAPVLTAISKNPSIRTLYMTRSLTGMKLKHIPTVMDALVNLIQKDDFPLAELVISENKLKNDIHDFINALGSNQSLQKLDISGNYMGDVGARLLAKALQINNKLRTIYMDKNNITPQGYGDIVYALENNHSMRTIQYPVFDITPHMKNHPEKTDAIMRKMQELLQRNCNGLKRANGQGFRLQHGFMLSSTHQLVDKLVAETQDNISVAKGSDSSAVQRLIDDAENCKQLMPKLQEAVRCESHPVEIKLTRIASDLSYTIQGYLEETLETMLRTAVEQCPKTLGSQMVVQDLRKALSERLQIPEDFLQSCLLNNAGSEIMNKVGEIEQSLAASISDRATDEVLEALTRYRRGLGIADSPSVLLDEPQTPDIVRSRSSHDADGLIIRPGRGSVLPKMGLESPTKLEYLNLATPHMPTKRRSVARKVRPQSVVENLSLGHIPDLLESPSSHRSSSQLSPRDSNGMGASIAGTTTGGSGNGLDDLGGDECGDSITELPSASFQLQHLVKGRPKRAKTRAPTRPLVAVDNSAGPSTKEIGEGLDLFFRPGSVTPTTLTPLISPTSEECSSLSFVDSPTMSRDGNGHLTSEETTPILEERRPIKLDRQSPLLKGVPWTTRSRSTDNLEKYSPLIGRKSPLVKMRTEGGSVAAGDEPNSALKAPERENKMRSPSSDSIRSHTGGDGISIKTTNGIIRTPIILQKPRPWSVVGNEPKAPGANDFQSSDSSKTTPEKLDEDAESIPFSQSSNNVGSAPGPTLEKKSVRELAAGLSRLELPMKPQVLPRTLLTGASAISKSSSTSHITSTNSSSISSSNSASSRSSSTTTTTTMLQTQRMRITSNSSSSSSSSTTTTTNTASSNATNGNENHETLLTKTVITENGNGSSSSSFITNEIINIRNGTNSCSTATTHNRDSTNTNASESSNVDRLSTGSNASSLGIPIGGFKRIAGKEISALFEETLVEGLQRSSTRRLFRDTQYTKEDVVDL
ncbi:F-actin-uncapping protein LRRC16A isoform X3 [Bactrocera neohumeralis]|uniref:F-actin-uncapping protein LRRC16A isoform X3 n=1 Tax=Bactrocera neohumeralis TaxID=98809 RepID=UPI002166BCD7|nr:F-actin-uncapping protein LRRC16A isoform X3 [Bactrocera neohumeralis]